MGTLLRIGWLNLRRDRVALALVFALPILFFSIFATVFAGQGDTPTSRIRVGVVDEDHSELSERLVEGLRKESGLRVRTTVDAAGAGPVLDRAAGERLVRNGDVPVAVVIPKGMGEAFAKNGFAGSSGPPIQLLSDVSDRIAPQMVLGLLQKVTMTAAPDLLMQGGMRQFEQYAGAMTPQQKAAVDQWMPQLKAQGQAGTGASSPEAAGGMGVRVEVVDVMRTDDRRVSLVSFYAAGIGVMFLLFSAVAGAGSALLDEVESGTLERLLSTNIGMTGLLGGKWILLTLIGFAAADRHVSLGHGRLRAAVVLAPARLRGDDGRDRVGSGGARSRARDARAHACAAVRLLDDSDPDDVGARRQHVPAVSDEREHAEDRVADVQRVGLDGYLKVFWRQAAVWQLWPQVLVLGGLTAVFLAAARMLARRWEAA